MLVPIESSYATSYYAIVNNTNVYTVFQLSRGNGQIIACVKGMPLANALILGNFCEYCRKSYRVNTKSKPLTALHGMQTRSSNENSVCPSVCHTREL